MNIYDLSWLLLIANDKLDSVVRFLREYSNEIGFDSYQEIEVFYVIEFLYIT